MKKIIFALTGILLFFNSSSCDPNKDKDDTGSGTNGGGVDIKYEMTVSIDALDVVKNLKDLDNTDLFPNGVIDNEGYCVRAQLFVFNEDGSLFSEDVQMLADFSQKAKVTKSMPSGKYTLVATADMVRLDGEKVEFQCWDFQNKTSLRNFRIVDIGYVGLEYKALGVSRSEVEIKKALSENIDVQPVGALITFFFHNLNASEMGYLYYAWNKDQDYYSAGDGTSNSVNDDIENEYEVDAQYTGFYDKRYFLPVNNVTLFWATLTKDIVVIKEGNTAFNVEVGNNITITVDVKAGTAAVSRSTRAASFSLDDIDYNRRPIKERQ
ncbi:MAG: hypothetical protein LBJ58_06485 [Tannerellaceae bacterium]|nr:hypothetical protein [Tannerellaceae bacterium]